MPELLDHADPSRRDREVTLPAPSASEGKWIDPAPALSPGLALGAGKTPLLLCERVSKWYGPVIGVNQVTLELRAGITGLVGANGAGKTTLLRLIAGQLRPDLGGVSIRGHDAQTARAKRLIGYCPEIDAFYEEMSGRQFVLTMARLCGYTSAEARRRTEEALELVGMADRADRCVRGFSKGMRQRVKLAQALLHDPELLVLDEPMSGIDPVGRWEFIALFHKLAERGKCLLISSHELEELEKLTERVAIMARGRIAAVGSVAQIRDRLKDHPLTIRIDLRKNAERNGDDPRRELAAALLRLPDVVGVEMAEDVGQVLVRARNPQRFFRDFGRLVLEEWYDVRHLETLDDSAEAVLGYLLGANG